MPIEIAIPLILFAVLVVGSLVYTIIRLWREPPPQDVSPKAQRLARLSGFPKLFDGLLARPMTRREIFGWLLYAIILVLAVTFTGKS
jgi:hypothetical protein